MTQFTQLTLADAPTVRRSGRSPEVRTYELFDIHWDRGSVWTAYQTEAEAQAVIDRSPSTGTVVRRTWAVVRRTWDVK